MPTTEKCKSCKAKPPRRGQPPCSTCKGRGEVIVTRDAKTGVLVSIEPAPAKEVA